MAHDDHPDSIEWDDEPIIMFSISDDTGQTRGAGFPASCLDRRLRTGISGRNVAAD